MCLSLARIGWDMNGPFALIDDLGVERLMTECSPAMFVKLLRQAVHRSLERKLTSNWSDPDFVGRRACIDHIKPLLSRTSKKLDSKGKAFLKAVVCGATWTQ
eukprot:13521991-Heterocapsa_arctica.AAC.1